MEPVFASEFWEVSFLSSSIWSCSPVNLSVEPFASSVDCFSSVITVDSGTSDPAGTWEASPEPTASTVDCCESRAGWLGSVEDSAVEAELEAEMVHWKNKNLYFCKTILLVNFNVSTIHLE